jgi:hypothetical protein
VSMVSELSSIRLRRIASVGQWPMLYKKDRFKTNVETIEYQQLRHTSVCPFNRASDCTMLSCTVADVSSI